MLPIEEESSSTLEARAESAEVVEVLFERMSDVTLLRRNVCELIRVCVLSMADRTDGMCVFEIELLSVAISEVVDERDELIISRVAVWASPVSMVDVMALVRNLSRMEIEPLS